MKPLPSYGLKYTITIRLQEWFWHEKTHESCHTIKQKKQTKLTNVRL